MQTSVPTDKSSLFMHPKLSSVDWGQKNLFLFVRHRGCTFCRESLDKLSRYMNELDQAGYKMNVVHMGPKESSRLMQEEFLLQKARFISNPERDLYKMFGARRGSLTEVLGLEVFRKGLLGGSVFKYGVGKLEGDGFQLGGLYAVEDKKIECWHRPKDAGDIEDWAKIISSHIKSAG